MEKAYGTYPLKGLRLIARGPKNLDLQYHVLSLGLK